LKFGFSLFKFSLIEQFKCAIKFFQDFYYFLSCWKRKNEFDVGNKDFNDYLMVCFNQGYSHVYLMLNLTNVILRPQLVEYKLTGHLLCFDL
jgi:hypothetical protein